MTTIYSPEVSAQVLDIMLSADISNQKRATVYGELSDAVREALTLSGHKICAATDLFGKPCRFVFAPGFYELACIEARSHMPQTRTDTRSVEHTFDYEGAILARQERRMMDY